ncbi:hypothetical protein ACF0H5_003120 [Mactra antiquata]
MSEAALDLSAKSTSICDETRISQRSYSNDTPPSPATPPRYASTSDGNESDNSMQPSILKPVPGTIPTKSRDSPCSLADINRDGGDSLPSSPTTPSSSGGSKQFKSQSLDNASSLFSSPSSAALLASQSVGLPGGLPVGLGLSSLYESSASFPSFPVTPLTSHLLQRKRRAESRSGTHSQDSNSDSEGKKLKHVPEEKKDTSYWERRRKNNEAAKRSRDNRRQKEEEIAMRAAFLEQENLKLRAQVAILKNETAKLHYMLYNRI